MRFKIGQTTLYEWQVKKQGILSQKNWEVQPQNYRLVTKFTKKH